MDKEITENAVDFLKAATAMAPPASVALFGISLEDWMFIASIVASIFIVLDKLPTIVRSIRERFQKQGCNGSSSGSPNHPPD